ncbi:YcxB family protein [Campylobacter sp. RM16188]|uniref:YcxB family protein n=1 Tax=Campylobacter sp. RM16188 TaxID=1705725 RepID=UPI001555C957|nr:YcxB family protein [Campylobacter sp. RM16188]
MQSEFECKFSVGDELLKRYVRVITRGQIRQIFFVTIFAICSMLLLFSVKDEFDRFEVGILSAAVTMIFLRIFIIYLTPKMTLNAIKQGSDAIHDKNRYETRLKFSDKIYMSEGDFALALKYSQIFKIYRLKDGFALMFGSKQAILIDVSKFREHEMSEIESFLFSKFDKSIFE